MKPTEIASRTLVTRDIGPQISPKGKFPLAAMKHRLKAAFQVRRVRMQAYPASLS